MFMTQEEKLSIVNEIKEELQKREIPLVFEGKELKSIPSVNSVTTIIKSKQKGGDQVKKKISNKLKILLCFGVILFTALGFSPTTASAHHADT